MVEDVKVDGEHGGIVGVVDGEGVEAGVLGQIDVGGIIRHSVHTWRLELDHVVREDHGSGGRALGRMDMLVSVTET